MEGWRQRLGGTQYGRWQQRLFLSLDQLYLVRESAATVKALRFAPTAGAARWARPELRPPTPKSFNYPVKGKKSSLTGLDELGPSHGRHLELLRWLHKEIELSHAEFGDCV
jgi:hypothetical protein